MTDLVLAKGEGSYINSECGKRMLDFTSGIGGEYPTQYQIVNLESLSTLRLTDP